MSFSFGIGAGLSRPHGRHSLAAHLRTRARLASERSAAFVLDGQTLTPTSPWRLSVGSAGSPSAPDAEVTDFYPAGADALGYWGGGALIEDYFGVQSRQFPVTTEDMTGRQLGDGTKAITWSVCFETDSAKVAFRVDGNFPILSRLQFFLDGQRVDLPEPVATNPGRRWLTMDLPTGPRRVMMRGIADTRFLGISVVPGASVSALQPNLRGIVVGDSFTEGAGLSFPWDGVAGRFGALFGIDDLWLSGSGGTGYLNRSPEGKMTFPERITSDLARALAAGPVDLILVEGGLNDVGQSGDFAGAVAQVLGQVRSHVPHALCVVLSPPDLSLSGPDWMVVRDQLAAAASEHGMPFVDLTGISFTTVDGVHPDASGAELLATSVAQAVADIVAG